jgi:uncharacterized membrane protein
MNKNRLEMFSDGVMAIIITIMVLELKVPHGTTLADILPLWPVFLSYILSFIYIGIYWNNHHHMFHLVKNINGGVMWANMHLLFWLSLIPFVTAWSGENHFAPLPVAAYGFVLLMSAIAYHILARTLHVLHGTGSDIAVAIGKDRKGNLSTVLYAAGVVAAFYAPFIALALYVAVAMIWIVPDMRVVKVLQKK